MNCITRILSIFLLMSCSTGHIVTTNLHNLANFEDNSQIFILPKTRVLVTFTVDKTEFIPGPYSKYAKKFLDLNDAQSISSVQHRITDIQINTQSIPDQDYCYSIRNENFGEIETFLNDLRGKDLIMEENPLKFQEQEGQLRGQNEVCEYEAIKPFYLTENTTARGNDYSSDFISIPFLKKQLAQKALEQKAEEAANFILKLRKRRFNLISGKYEVFPQGAALSTSVLELNKLEEKYLSLFIGKSKTKSFQRTYTVVPDEGENLQRFTLLRFSTTTGFLSAEDESGEALVLQLKDLKTDATIAQLQQSGSTTQHYDIIHYRIADLANAKILYGSHEVLETEIPIFQFGTLLPKFISPVKKKLF